MVLIILVRLGLYGTAGPPMIIFFSSAHLHKDVTRGTACFCDNVINLCRIFAFSINYMFSESDVNNTFGTMSMGELLALFLAVTVGATGGLALGNSVSRYINQFAFKYIVLFILGVGSVLLSSVGLHSHDAFIVVVIEVVLFVSSVLAVFWCLRKRTLHENTAQRGQEIEYTALSVVEMNE